MSARTDAMLARKAAAQAPGRSDATCPRELRTPCVVWDWLSATEAVDVERNGMNSPLVARTWRRWLDARSEYAARVGVTEAVACGPVGRPTLGEHAHPL
ncbi:hypothetical protein G3I62_27260 [Streptomyces sp. SID14446]|uniref:hypothetical protein n=1 Tax=Streptomyces sp. SID14446 TaxID=2706072 RepID=UPI0013B7196C|nr:hypothetical protein [Streptomyces sp. SID14446]NEB32748.1 hypothetical protein [Streptomyces sp. SID14446]